MKIMLMHYTDVTMSAMAYQITVVPIVCSVVCSGAHQRKCQSSASLVFVRGIHRWPTGGFPLQREVTLKMFPFDDVIMDIIMRMIKFVLRERYFITLSQWCIVGYGIDALCDMCNRFVEVMVVFAVELLWEIKQHNGLFGYANCGKIWYKLLVASSQKSYLKSVTVVKASNARTVRMGVKCAPIFTPRKQYFICNQHLYRHKKRL